MAKGTRSKVMRRNRTRLRAEVMEPKQLRRQMITADNLKKSINSRKSSTSSISELKKRLTVRNLTNKESDMAVEGEDDEYETASESGDEDTKEETEPANPGMFVNKVTTPYSQITMESSAKRFTREKKVKNANKELVWFK